MKINEIFKSRKNIMLAGASILVVAFVIFGISYAFFSYTKQGTTENTIESGNVKFIYNEGSPTLNVSDMMPMTDAQGKAQTDYFDFTVRSTTGSSFQIPYTITARVDDSVSTLDPKVVKVWLSDGTTSPETEYTAVSYFGGLNNGVDDTTNNPSPSLSRFTDVAYALNYNERILYTGTIPANSNNLTKNFRLRMWVASNADFSPKPVTIPAHCTLTDGGATVDQISDQPATSENCIGDTYTWVEQETTTEYPLNNKRFTVTVNVYANGQLASEPQTVTFQASEVSYTNSYAPGITTVEGALDDLTTRLGG